MCPRETVTFKYLVVVSVFDRTDFFFSIALRQMRISSEENQPGGDIHHPTRMNIKLFICLSVSQFLMKYKPTANLHKSKDDVLYSVLILCAEMGPAHSRHSRNMC